MKLRHKPIVVDAVKFKQGMEDGIHTSEHEGREPWDKYTLERPYIWHKHKKIWVNFGEYLITEQDGMKYVMTEQDIKKYFDPIKDETDLKLGAIFDI